MPIIYLLCLTLIFIHSLDAEDAPNVPNKSVGLLTSLEGEPTGVIDGCVNVITGQFFDREVDMTIPGPEPLTVERVLIDNNLVSKTTDINWLFSHEGITQISGVPVSFVAYYNGTAGELLKFESRKENQGKQELAADIATDFIKQGFTNTTQGIISGQTNARNCKFYWRERERKCRLDSANGSKSYFTYGATKYGNKYYFLDEEAFPHGLKISYVRDKHNDPVSRTLKNKKNDSLASYSILEEEFSRKVQACDGRKVIYEYDKVGVKGDRTNCLQKVRRVDAPHVSYTYDYFFLNGSQFTYLTGKNYPDNHFLQIEYYKRDTHSIADHQFKVGFEDPFYFNVCQLKAPIGADAQALPKYQFIYRMPNGIGKGGHTEVYDALLRRTDYLYNDRQRLTGILKYNQAGDPYTIESIHWGAEDTVRGIELQARTFGVDGKNSKIYSKVYRYNDVGDIIEERLYGNFSGHGAKLVVNSGGKPLGTGIECRKKTFAYSNDNLHLLTESVEGGVKKKFVYIPESNLLKACYQLEGSSIFCRDFYLYDDNGLMIRHSSDDGKFEAESNLSGVTVRKIEYIERSTTYPYGLPLVITQKYIDENGYEKLINRTVNKYDQLGRLIHKDVFDSNNQFAFNEQWKFDAHGNMLLHVNALGESDERTYDANDNLLSMQSAGLKKHYIYDYMNRLIREDELHADGVLSKHYRYDLCSNLIASVDVFGNETAYIYDAYNRPVQVIGASICGKEGNLYRPQTKYTYDELSNPIKITDPEGNATVFKYTLDGKPYYILYPDGSEEHFEFDLLGRPIKEVSKNGLITKYTYDAQGRLTNKKIYSSSNQLLYQTEAGYNNLHLLWEKDPAGTLTTYKYDRMGRKICMQKEDLITHFEYDSLGRETKVIISSESDPKEGSVKVFSYDKLSRVVEERAENLQGVVLSHVRYAYDAAGHKTRIEQDTGITEIQYDSHGIPIKTIDPEGHETHARLVLGYKNANGQHVYCLETTDALGQVTVIVHDAQGRIVEKKKKDPQGKEIQRTQYILNANGLCLQAIDTVFFLNMKMHSTVREYTYDALGRPVMLVQAAGTVDEKRTTTTYTCEGQKETITKPSGVVLQYKYDPLGRLVEESASDQSIHYRYTYDLLSKPIRVENLSDLNVTERELDAIGRMCKEKLANGLVLELRYTPEGEIKKVVLPDQSSIEYAYDGSLIKEVKRVSQKGIVQYRHRYDNYDSAGRLLSSTLIHDLGSLTNRYNKRGELVSLSSPFYSEELEYDVLGNALKRKQKGDSEPDLYTYDALYQIKKEEGAITHSYQHDSLYNRRKKNDHKYALNGLNQVVSDGERLYTYDTNGNLIQAGERHFTYDALDRLIELKIGAIRFVYTYDELHRCLTRTQYEDERLVALEKRLYVGMNDISTADESNNVHTLRVLGRGLGAEIGASIAIELNGEIYAPLHDHIGNLVALIDRSGKCAESYRYSAFGEERIFDADMQPIESSLLSNPWRFASKRHELDYLSFGHRLYDPSLGRWLTPDPLGYEAGSNLYAYVSNSPLTHFDAYGLFEQESSGFWTRARDRFQGMMVSLRDGLRTVCQTIRQGIREAGKFIKEVSRNVIPFPLIKEIGGMAGHFLEQGSFKGYRAAWQNPHSCVEVSEKPLLKINIRLSFLNGLNTTKEEARAFVEIISHLFYGARVDLIYNATHDIGEDVFECCLQKCGIMTHSVMKTVKYLRTMIDEVGGVGSSGLVVVMAMSQGGQVFSEAINSLSAEERAMIAVATLGSAKIIAGRGVHSAINYISTRDPVPLSDPFNYVNARLGNMPEVHFMRPGKNAPLIDHSFISEVYQGALSLFKQELFKELW